MSDPYRARPTYLNLPLAWTCPEWARRSARGLASFLIGIALLMGALYAWQLGFLFCQVLFDVKPPNGVQDAGIYVFLWFLGAFLMLSPIWATALGKKFAHVVADTWRSI